MTRTKAYSYIRFSTGEQKHGTSLVRQVEMAQQLADKMGWELDTSLRDEGVSGFRGKNVESGALGRFIKMVEKGDVEPGSVLIFENFDRMSRLPPTEAFSLFTQLLHMDVSIYTVCDGQMYTKERVNRDVSSLLISITTMVRAHEESTAKSLRQLATWDQKRKNARTKKLTGKCPSWLKLSDDGTEFHVIEERAEVVRRIFQMMDEGMGAYTICKALNAEGVPTFGRTEVWGTAYIHALVYRQAVIGHYQPRKSGGSRPEAARVIKDYYPAIIDDNLYWRVVGIRNEKAFQGAGRKGKHYSNLFTGISKCASCGGSMIYRDQGHDKVLQCSNYVKGACGNRKRFPYRKLEAEILDSIAEIDIKQVLPDHRKSELSDVTKKLKGLEEKLADLRQTKRKLIRQFGEGDDEEVDEVLAEVAREIDDADNLKVELERRKNELSVNTKKLAEHIRDIDAFRELVASSSKADTFRYRAALSAEIKKVINRMEFDSDGGIWVETGRDGQGYIITAFLPADWDIHELQAEADEHSRGSK